MSEHIGEYVTELRRHIRHIDACGDCAARLGGIEAELAELNSNVEDMAGTLALILGVLTKQPKPEGESR